MVRRTRLFAGLAVFLLGMMNARAQLRPDTANTVAIQIISTRTGSFSQNDTGGVNRLIGDVILEQAGTRMECDSAILDVVRNNVEAFGHVVITQPGGTRVESDYLRYTGNTRGAYLRGAVALSDGSSNLWSEVLTYDLGRKVGTFSDNGTLQSGETLLSSRRGSYNLRSKDARFTGDVVVNNPRYDVVSDDLGYNTGTKVVRFFGPSVVTNDRSELRATGGYWDEVRERARFVGRSAIWSSDQYVEADTLYYDRQTGFGTARGDVYALDTAQHVTLWSQFAAYNEIGKTLLATRKPVLRRVSGTDSLFMRADTFLTGPDIPKRLEPAPSVPSGDTAAKKPRRPRRGQPAITTASASTSDTLARRPPRTTTTTASTRAADSTAADTATARFFVGYPRVRVWSDSMQAVCDSVRYTQRDSALRLMRDPVAWARAGQISGDTLVLYADSGRVRQLWVPGNALMISRSGPEQAELYDQVQGRTLTGFFAENQLTEMLVKPSAESIYFATDDVGAYIGANEAQAERMRIFFGEGKIRRIVLEQDPKQTMTPMDKANLQGLRLSRFQWREEERPKSRAEIFR